MTMEARHAQPLGVTSVSHKAGKPCAHLLLLLSAAPSGLPGASLARPLRSARQSCPVRLAAAAREPRMTTSCRWSSLATSMRPLRRAWPYLRVMCKQALKNHRLSLATSCMLPCAMCKS